MKKGVNYCKEVEAENKRYWNERWKKEDKLWKLYGNLNTEECL